MFNCWIITSSKQFIFLTTNLPLLSFPPLAHYNCFQRVYQHPLWSETIYYGGWLNKFTILWSHLLLSLSTWSVEFWGGERRSKTTSKERSFCRSFLVGIIIFICEVDNLQIVYNQPALITLQILFFLRKNALPTSWMNFLCCSLKMVLKRRISLCNKTT